MRRAFTLIELMIVISAIAIIAAIAIPNLMASASHRNPSYRYTIVKQSGTTLHTNSIVRLPDGVRFVDEYGNVVEVHGTYTVYDSQPQAEAQ